MIFAFQGKVTRTSCWRELASTHLIQHKPSLLSQRILREREREGEKKKSGLTQSDPLIQSQGGPGGSELIATH